MASLFIEYEINYALLLTSNPNTLFKFDIEKTLFLLLYLFILSNKALLIFLLNKKFNLT